MLDLDKLQDKSDHSMHRDIGSQGTWSVSSSKPGYGIDQLLDPRLGQLWQSEGPQPHLISVQFRKRMSICQISMFIDVQHDDSYTPQKLALRAGTHFGDLQDIRTVNLEQPRGWQHFKLGNYVDVPADEVDWSDPEALAIKANVVQVVIMANHLNGKDTHVRGLKIYAPREPIPNLLTDEELQPFTSPAFTMHRTVR